MNNLDQICNEKILIKSLYKLLKKNNYCFIRGAFVFEDNKEDLFNLLTTGSIQKNKYKECKKITRDRGTVCFTSHDDFLLNSKFTKKRKGKDSKYKINDEYARDKLLYKYYIPPFRSLSMYEKIIDNGIILKCDEEEKIFNVILFYPFKLKDTDKIFLYFKLEESRCLSISHLTNYLYSKRIKKEKVDIRREKDIYTFDLYKKDIVFYKDIIKEYYKDDKSIKTQILKSVEDYNDNIRVGAEFFIPTELLVIIFNIYKKNYNNTLLKNKIIKNI
jgi:hypothetical protein